MKKKKLNLEELKLDSFVTSFENDSKMTAKGGSSFIICFSNNCIGGGGSGGGSGDVTTQDANSKSFPDCHK